MSLDGQDGQRGYAMAALLVSIAVMAILMSAAMPAYRHLAMREKEAELVFRGEQYARAIALFRMKNGNQFPPSIDVLVQGKYLRKKYKDPMTPDGEFRLIPVGNPAGGQNPPQGRGDQGRGGLASTGGAQPRGGSAGGSVSGSVSGTVVSGGIMGVASKSTENSIKIYKGQTRYDLWPFTFNMVNRPGGNMPGAVGPGGRGGQREPGGRGVGRGRGDGRGGRGIRPDGRGRGPGGLGGRRGGRGETFVPFRPGGRGREGGAPNQAPDL